MDFEDNICFDSYMIKPSNLRDIWSISQVKKKMFEYMQWYFRPKNSYEPERVDYNALNILAEYQTYNLEFLKNELDLNDEQTANVLQALWNLLEFDPDEKSIVQDVDAAANQRSPENNIAYLGDDIIDIEEEAFKVLLNKKFMLFKKLLTWTTEHQLESARITVEQARRVAIYTHETYFRHLRLYDFVLKNTKLSEVKRIYIPVPEPKCGEELTKAMVLVDESVHLSTDMLLVEENQKNALSGMTTTGAAKGSLAI